MYKKVIVFVVILFLILIFELVFQFVTIQKDTIEASKKALLLNIATDNFYAIGYAICIITWVLANILAIKTKKLIWFWMPFLLTVVVAVFMGYFDECIFVFNKQNGFSKGGFSMSYFLTGMVILASIIVLEINYFAFKFYLMKKKPVNA